MINSGALPNVAFRKPQCPDRCGAPSCPSPPRSATRAGAALRPQTRTASTRRPHRADPKRPPAARATAAVLVAHREQSSYWPCAQSPFYATPEPARVQHREPRPNGPLFVHGPSASLESDILRGAVHEKGGRRHAKPSQSLQIRTHERAERDDMQPAGSDVVQRPCGQASAVKCAPLRPARGDVFPRSSLLSASRCRSRLAGRPTLQAGGHRFDPGTLHEDLEAEESG